jgi:transcriptional regulator with XRE-family HTH domain
VHASAKKAAGPRSVGEILRYWRGRKKMSQMELALTVDVSTRHLSFVETGRSRPSRELVLRLGAALDLPLRQCNTLLTAAGYAAKFSHTPLDGEEMALVQETLHRLLSTHEPYPALVVDSDYEILMSNTAFDLVVARFGGEKALKRFTNIYRLTFSVDGLRDAFWDWPVVEQFLLARLLGEAVATQHQGLFDLHAEMAALGSGQSPADIPIDQGLPILSFTLRKGGISASFFSTITTFGTPLDVTAQELRIESLFPADEATRQWLRKAV